MSEPLPTHIDPVKLAQRHAALKGELSLEKLPRLAESLCETTGSVQVNWQFSLDAQQRLTITGSLHTCVMLLCQRCLQPMPWMMELNIAQTQLAAGQTAVDLPVGFEAFEYTAQLPLLFHELVEDELILALPLVPKHEQCPSNDYQFAEISTAVSPSAAKANPFAVLAALKNK